MTQHQSVYPRPERILIVAHTGRPENVEATRLVVQALRQAGITSYLLAEEHHDVGSEIPAEQVEPEHIPTDIDLVFVMGGDGTILRAAELSRPMQVPLLGVNLGRVGFLAEGERERLPDVVGHVVDGHYELEERMVVDVVITKPDGTQEFSWALNEVSVEKVQRERMIELVIEVDRRPVSNFGADGVVLATPTGSTAYAFSAGGPVVWPEVEALLVVPLCAHALFARPLVTSPTSVLAVEILDACDGVVWCDGRRAFDAPVGSRVEVRRSDQPISLARLDHGPFTDRLVAKFRLPITGWRGPRRTTRSTTPDA